MKLLQVLSCHYHFAKLTSEITLIDQCVGRRVLPEVEMKVVLAVVPGDGRPINLLTLLSQLSEHDDQPYQDLDQLRRR